MRVGDGRHLFVIAAAMVTVCLTEETTCPCSCPYLLLLYILLMCLFSYSVTFSRIFAESDVELGIR